MNFFQTSLGIFIYKAVATFAMLGAGIILFKSAANSFRKSGKWISALDEIIVGFIGLVIYALIISTEPMVIVNFLKTPIMFIWNMFLTFLREFLGLPV